MRIRKTPNPEDAVLAHLRSSLIAKVTLLAKELADYDSMVKHPMAKNVREALLSDHEMVVYEAAVKVGAAARQYLAIKSLVETGRRYD